MSPLRRVAKGKSVERECTKLCRRLVVEIRDQNTCQRCGAQRGFDPASGMVTGSQLHWAHVKNRGARSLVYVPWASLALCAGCHIWFDAHKGRVQVPGEGLRWWADKYPDRWRSLIVWESGHRAPVNRVAEVIWLRQMVNEAGREEGSG